VAAVADIDGDRSPDVVLTHQERNALSVLVNDGSGRFSPVEGSPIALRLPAAAVIVADVNRDNAADLVATTVNSTAAPYDSEVVVLLGTGRGQFAAASASPFRAGRGAFMLASGDVNADGRLDFAASSFSGDGTTVLLGQ
jgi:alkaline phosphatase